MESPEVPKESKINYWHENIMRPAIVEYQKTGSEDLYTSVLHQPFCELCKKLYLGYESDRDDAVQECILRLHSKLKKFDDKKPVKALTWFTWLAKWFYIWRYKQHNKKLERQILAPDYEDVIWPNFEPDKLDEFLKFFEDPANIKKVCGKHGNGKRRHEVVSILIQSLATGDCATVIDLTSRTSHSTQGVWDIANRMVSIFNARKL